MANPDEDLDTTCIDLTHDDSPLPAVPVAGPARLTRSSSSGASNAIDLTSPSPSPIELSHRTRYPAAPRRGVQLVPGKRKGVPSRLAPSYPIFRSSKYAQTSPIKLPSTVSATTQTGLDSVDANRTPRASSNEADDLPALKDMLGCDFETLVKNARSKAAAKDSPSKAMMTCPVCLDDLKELRKQNVGFQCTPCGHMFCQPCILGILTRGAASSICPSCRKPVKQKDLRTIFL